MNSRCICAKCAALKSVIGIGCNFRAIPVTVKLTRDQEATAARREGGPEDEAKPGDLFTP